MQEIDVNVQNMNATGTNTRE